MQLIFTLTGTDENLIAVTAKGEAITGFQRLVIEPEPVVGKRYIPIGRLKALGNSGREVLTDIVFDTRKGEFLIRPKKLDPKGFEFDRSEVAAYGVVSAAAEEPAAEPEETFGIPAPPIKRGGSEQ